MNLIITLFAALSALITTLIFYYNLKIVNKFREDEELTATKLVIKERVPDAFMALSISSLFFSLGAFIGATLILFRLQIFQYFTEIGIITMLVGLLTFMKRISDAVTEGKKDEVENEQRKEEKSEPQEDEKENMETENEKASKKDSEEEKGE